jgi:hypothetical protein
MRKGLWGFLIVVSIMGQLSGHSRTFFTPRQVSTDQVIEYGMTQYQIYWELDKEEEPSKFYVKPFYQHSMDAQDMARYFLPCNNIEIRIQQNGLGDVCSAWVDLLGPYVEDEDEGTIALTNYASTYTLEPVRITYGVNFQWYMDLSRALPHTWLSINTAAVQASHALNLQECGGNIGVENNIRNACDAFDNGEWRAGRIYRGKFTACGLDDIQVKVGYDFTHTDRTHCGIYGIASIPTGHEIPVRYIFEPFVGSQHAGLGFGVHYDRKLREHNKCSLTLLLDARYRYMFSAWEQRLFDLCSNGDWSRYLQVVTGSAFLEPKPLINNLYFDTKVRPRSTIDLWGALHYEHRGFNLEVGYNFWWRASEKGTVCGCFPSDYAIYNLSGGCSPTFTCAPTANISQGADGTNAVVSSTDCTTLTFSDIDINSGLHPTCFTHKFYGGISYQGRHNNFPTFIGVGASGEISPSRRGDSSCCVIKKKNAFGQWAVWLALGGNF